MAAGDGAAPLFPHMRQIRHEAVKPPASEDLGGQLYDCRRRIEDMKKLYLRQKGILPGTDVTLALANLFSEHRTDTEFIFEEGDYYFSPQPELVYDYRNSNGRYTPERRLGIWMRGMRDCVVRGNGARFYYAGMMQAITLDSCQNISLENFVIDWKKPLMAEGVVVAFSEKTIDLFIDPVLFPHRERNGWIEFDAGNGEWAPLENIPHVQFDVETNIVRRDSGDKFCPSSMEVVGKNVYRFTAGYTETAIGNIFALRFSDRRQVGTFVENCHDITFSDVTVHSCSGLGFLCQFNHNLTFRRVHLVPNVQAGRRVTGPVVDGFHCSCNAGRITVTECTFKGMMDDPINVHGAYTLAVEAMDEKRVTGRYGKQWLRGFHYWARTGETICFLDRRNMTSVGSAVVDSYELDDLDTFHLQFREPLPENVLALVKEGLVAMENVDNTPSFVCTKNRFGSCRARGLLVSTQRPVLIAENYFESSGSAILMAGDLLDWHESGPCYDVEIRDNVFTDRCLTSMYQYCEGVICIHPQVPEADVNTPYHRNIRITNNIFDTADTTVLYAISCGGLTFADNRIYKSYAAPKWHPGEAAIELHYCREGALSHNKWIGKFGFERILDMECCEMISAQEIGDCCLQ